MGLLNKQSFGEALRLNRRHPHHQPKLPGWHLRIEINCCKWFPRTHPDPIKAIYYFTRFGLKILPKNWFSSHLDKQGIIQIPNSHRCCLWPSLNPIEIGISVPWDDSWLWSRYIVKDQLQGKIEYGSYIIKQQIPIFKLPSWSGSKQNQTSFHNRTMMHKFESSIKPVNLEQFIRVSVDFISAANLCLNSSRKLNHSGISNFHVQTGWMVKSLYCFSKRTCRTTWTTTARMVQIPLFMLRRLVYQNRERWNHHQGVMAPIFNIESQTA